MANRDGEWTYPGPRKVPYDPPTWRELAQKWEDMADKSYRLMYVTLAIFGVVAVLLSFGWLPVWLFLVSGALAVLSAGGAVHSLSMRDKCQDYDLMEAPESLCQFIDPRVADGLPCEYRESGGYRCERLDPHGDDGHWWSEHTIRHSIAGNGYACSSFTDLMGNDDEHD